MPSYDKHSAYEPTKVTQRELSQEREQLRSCWERRLPLFNALARTPEEIYQLQKLGCKKRHAAIVSSQIRQFHDKLGLKAKDTLATGGLCAGALYRTGSFIKTKQSARSGIRKNQKQNIHIEHTVPVSALRDTILRKEKIEQPWLLWFLLKHSVATAMTNKQKEGLPNSIHGLSSDKHYRGFPFRRYDGKLQDEIWDVWSGRRIERDHFTFDHHLAVVINILDEVKALELRDSLLTYNDEFVV